MIFCPNNEQCSVVVWIFTLLVFWCKRGGYFLLFPLEANSCSDGSLIAAVLKAADSPRHPNFSQRAFSIQRNAFSIQRNALCQSCFHRQRTFFGEKCYKKGKKTGRKKHAVSYIWVFDKLDLWKVVCWSVSNTSENWESFPLKLPTCHREEMKQHIIKHHQIAGGKKIKNLIQKVI